MGGNAEIRGGTRHKRKGSAVAGDGREEEGYGNAFHWRYQDQSKPFAILRHAVRYGGVRQRNWASRCASSCLNVRSISASPYSESRQLSNTLTVAYSARPAAERRRDDHSTTTRAAKFSAAFSRRNFRASVSSVGSGPGFRAGAGQGRANSSWTSESSFPCGERLSRFLERRTRLDAGMMHRFVRLSTLLTLHDSFQCRSCCLNFLHPGFLT